MKVVVPATADHSPHLQAVRDALVGVDYEVHLVSGDDGYWQLLSDIWAQGEGVILIEHDVIASKAVVAELIACEGDWCCCPYPYGRGTIVGLGCTKFTGALMARVPDAVLKAGERSDRTHPPKHWCRADASLQRVLRDADAEVPGTAVMHHRHSQVEHLNHGRSSHGCRG
jgi:hypothetical protein